MILVGITGAINHGKTSLAEYLKTGSQSAAHYESSDIIIEVANALRASSSTPSAEDTEAIVAWLRALPSILEDVTHTKISFDDLNITAESLRADGAVNEFSTLISYLRLVEFQPELTSSPINISNKDNFRMLLQWLGGYLAKHVSGQLWFDEIVRRGQSGQYELVIAGGVRFPQDAECLRTAGGIIVNIVRPGTTESDSQDVTERERNDIVADVTVINDANLLALQLTAQKLYDDLISNSLQANYTASTLEPASRTGLSFN